ncbi:MAG: hypothetical protein LBN29_11510 [Mediterranea sp.]|jgi:hypothetical protein|nr:hypothetical protein [Mediterranea sp.]
MKTETTEKKSKTAFKDQYDALDDRQKGIVFTQFTAKSGLSLATFYYKLRHGNFSLLEARLFSKIMATACKKAR